MLFLSPAGWLLASLNALLLSWVIGLARKQLAVRRARRAVAERTAALARLQAAEAGHRDASTF